MQKIIQFYRICGLQHILYFKVIFTLFLHHHLSHQAKHRFCFFNFILKIVLIILKKKVIKIKTIIICKL